MILYSQALESFKLSNGNYGDFLGGWGEEVWFIPVIIAMPCFILNGDVIVIFSVSLSFSIVLLFMDHRQRKTSCYYWSISRKFFWAIKQPFPFPPSLMNCCKATVLRKWIRWMLFKKITRWPYISKCPLYIITSQIHVCPVKGMQKQVLTPYSQM